MYDHGHQRITVFDLASGTFVERPLESARCSSGEPLETESACGIAAVLSDGRLVAAEQERRQLPGPTGEWETTEPLTRHLGVVRGMAVERVDSVEGAPVARYWRLRDEVQTSPIFLQAPAPFAAAGTYAFGTDRIVIAVPPYELRIRDGDGALIRIVRVDLEPVPLTPDSLDALRQWARSDANRFPQTGEYLDAMEPAGAIPQFGDVRLDVAGRIWGLDYAQNGIFGSSGPRGATIFDADGTPIGRMPEYPSGVLDVGADHVLLLRRDSLDVPRVERYAIVR